MPSITIRNNNKRKKRTKKMQAANYAEELSIQNSQQIEKQRVRVRLSSGIMDELMDKAYVSVYDPFRELIANAYDANAYKVRIEVEDEHSCYIDDDGYGISDFNTFLTKGMTEKREQKKGTSESGRQMIGEKGLGFLSVFKIAREVDVYSRPGPQTWKVHLTDELIRNSIDTGAPIEVEDAGEFLTYG
ncbi:MAG: ATP-binding protein, partial [Nitrososphaerota archaeon]|nr:ATP-binding protein [Nitrososphaerota archaeon]